MGYYGVVSFVFLFSLNVKSLHGATLFWASVDVQCPQYGSTYTAINDSACYDNPSNRGNVVSIWGTNYFAPNGTRLINSGNCNADEIPSRFLSGIGWCLKKCPELTYSVINADPRSIPRTPNPCGTGVPLRDYPSNKIFCVSGY